MFFISGSFFLRLLLYFGAAALAAQFLSCALVIMRCCRRHKKTAGNKNEGVTLLCSAGGGAQNIEAMERSLRSAFAVTYHNKEIIICLAGAAAAKTAIIRKIREDYAETVSLLVINDDKADEDETENTCLSKGWKAARHDWVMMLAPGLIVPPDCLERFFALWRDNGQRAANRQISPRSTDFFAAQAAADWEVGIYPAKRTGRQTGLVCAALWGVRPQGLPALLEAAFLNSWQMRRLLLADSLGWGVAQDSAQFWHYDIMNAAGGIKVFAQAAGKSGMAAAATHILRRHGKKIRLATPPVTKDLSLAAAAGFCSGQQGADFKALLRRQLGRLEFYRRFLPQFFYAELFLGAFLPILAVLLACFGGAAPVWLPVGFVILWYGAEILLILCLNHLMGEKSKTACARQSAILPVRDMILPFLWLLSLLKKPL